MQVVLHRNFKKKIKRLPVKIQRQFLKRVEIFLKDPKDPILNNHSVDNTFPGCRSINVTGDYRAIFIDEGQVILFTHIGTHSDLY